jgi:phage/plasmid-associated DNA primase
LFSANEIPITTEEKSEAIYRRMMIIKVDRKPTEDMKNINLEKDLTQEINYSIMKSCRALQRLYQNGSFSETESSVSNIEELRMEADNIFAFLTERTKKMPGKSAKTSEMYEEYVKYCDDFGRKKVSLHSFHKNLKNKGYTKKRGSGGGYEVYEDVVLLDANSLDADENGFVKVDVDRQTEFPWKVQ